MLLLLLLVVLMRGRSEAVAVDEFVVVVVVVVKKEWPSKADLKRKISAGSLKLRYAREWLSTGAL